MFSLKLFLSPQVSEIGLLTGTFTRRSEAGWSLQTLESVHMFTQTAKWWQLLALLTNSRCLFGEIRVVRIANRANREAPKRGDSRGAKKRREYEVRRRRLSSPDKIRFQVTRYLMDSNFSGELLDNAYESTEKLVAPILAVTKKYGATIACRRAQDVCLV